MVYDNEELDALCESINLFEYIESTQEYSKKSGDLYFYHCNRHSDSDPSVCVYPTQTWYCFSCGKGGTILQWLMYQEGLSFEESVEKLQQITGKQLKPTKHSNAMQYFKEARKQNEHIVKTVERQPLDFKKDYIDRFVDETPEEWVSEGIDPQVMKRFNIRVDKSANRIVYPVYDNDRRFIGVKGRTRFRNFKSLKIQKYMNYNKIETTDFFSGMKENRESIQKTKSIIIFEGLKSVMKASGWGFTNTVAAETSTLNEKQVALLIKMGVKEVTIAFDVGVEFNKIKECTKLLRRFCKVYIIKDTHKLLEDKDAPVDKGEEVWRRLYAERKRL